MKCAFVKKINDLYNTPPLIVAKDERAHSDGHNSLSDSNTTAYSAKAKIAS
jgi:hypothetical protein